MPDGLYERDFMLWSEVQADLLRRLASGELVNAAVDWPNLIDEVQDLGKSEFHACQSLVEQALLHLLKREAWPNSLAVNHWMAETITFLAGARRRYAPSMRQKFDLAGLYADAVRAVRAETDESGTPLPLSDMCPFTLEQLLADNLSPLWAD